MATWTADQVLALAPAASSVKSGKGLANRRYWLTLGGNQRAFWSECRGSAATPYRTQIDLHGPAFKCSCPSRKFLCKHVLGLFLIFASEPEQLMSVEPPGWVAEWLAQRDEQARSSKQQPAPEVDPTSRPGALRRRPGAPPSATSEYWPASMI